MLSHGQIMHYSDLDPMVNAFKPQVPENKTLIHEASNAKKDSKENAEWKQVKKHTKLPPKTVEIKVVSNGQQLEINLHYILDN